MGYTFQAYRPWKKNSDQEQRWGFVQLVLRAKMGLAELCRRAGISRKTAYQWMARFRERGRRGLKDDARCARRLHNRPQPKWLHRLRRCKAQPPSWGAPKIRWKLQPRFGRIGLPSAAAMGRWLKRWGRTRRRRARVRQGPSLRRPALTQAPPPNEVWTVDFKGWFRTGDGTKVEPLTVRDLASRSMLGFCLMSQQSVAAARVAMEGIFQI
jgi:putative transposase